MDTGKKVLCPSYRCVPGVQLIGVTRSDGKVHFVGRPVSVDREFVQTAQEGRPPELRFRFAHPCAQGSCQNWAEDHCGIAARVAARATDGTGELPNCGIREACRWHREWGEGICASCSDIVHG